MTVTRSLLTAADLEAMGDEAERYELLSGQLREVAWMGLRHGAIGGGLHFHVAGFVFERDLGEVCTSDTRFVFPGDRDSVLAPDIAFIPAGRLPPGELSDRYARVTPDLVVEIVSPSNSASDILGKVVIYLTGGVRLVWVVRAARRTVTVFRPDAPEIVLGENDLLEGGDVLPGFALPVAAIFRRHGQAPG